MPDLILKAPSTIIYQSPAQIDRAREQRETLRLAVESVMKARFAQVSSVILERSSRLGPAALLLLISEVTTAPIMGDIMNLIDYLE